MQLAVSATHRLLANTPPSAVEALTHRKYHLDMAKEEESHGESNRERFLRRAAEARRTVARLAPELLGETGVDPSLLDATLSRSVLERLGDAERHARGNDWLRALPHVSASAHR